MVCSELLFRGFNASIMSVDVGVDISAIKDNKFLVFRLKLLVKTALIHTRFILEKNHLTDLIKEIFFIF